MYGDNSIRQLMGGRKYVKFIYNSGSFSSSLTFEGRATPVLKSLIDSREMENGEIRFKDRGFRFNSKIEIYNLDSGDEINIMNLNNYLKTLKAGTGSLYLYLRYDPIYTSASQNCYKVFESGDRSPEYLHETLPNAQVFGYTFTGIEIDDGILNRVTLVTAIGQTGVGGYYGTII